MAGLVSAIPRLLLGQKDVDTRAISALTRVFRRAMRGHDGRPGSIALGHALGRCRGSPRPSSRNERERIGPLEAALGGPAVEIALLIADRGDDLIARVLDLAALLGLERLHRGVCVVVGTGEGLLPAFEAGAVEIEQRRLAFAVAAAGD